jgi:hypothetical protein
MRINSRKSAGTVDRPVPCRLFHAQNTAEPTPMPRNDGVRLHEDDRCPPLAPDAREPHPEEPVGCGETEAWSPQTFQHVRLMSEGRESRGAASPASEAATAATGARIRRCASPIEGSATLMKTSMNSARAGFLVGTGCCVRAEN